MAMLEDIYNKKLSKATIGMYWDILKPFPIEKVRETAQRIIENHVYNTMPKPAEFIKYLNPPKNVEALAFTALREVENAFPDNGYSSICFDDPLIHHVIDNLGGWVRVCEETYHMDDKEYSIWKYGFMARYKAFCDSPPQRPVPRLLGTHEIGNTEKGYLATKNRAEETFLLTHGQAPEPALIETKKTKFLSAKN